MKFLAAMMCFISGLFVTTAARADTTICQATQGGYGSYCSDQSPAATAYGGFNSLPSWINIQKNLTAIAVSDDHVWGLDSAGTLWYLANFKAALNWVKVTSNVSQISAGHNLICQLSTASHLLCSVSPNPLANATNSSGFNPITWYDAGATNFHQIAVSAGNQIWAVDLNNNLNQIADYTNLTKTKLMVAAGVQQVSVDGKGLLCETDLSSNIYCNNWPVPPSYTDWSGYHSLSGWLSIGKQLQTISLADGKVYGTDASGSVWLLPDYTNSSTWEMIAYGGVNDVVSASTVPSSYVDGTFAPGEVAVMMFMGQSNSSGINAMPTRFIAPVSPNVWGVVNQGWNYLPSNANGTTPYTGTIAGISMVQWTNWSISPNGPDMNLGFNTSAAGNAANFAAYQWQGMINAGAKLPDLYIFHIAWPSQGVDAADNIGSPYPYWPTGNNLWQPLLTNAQQSVYALAPFARRIVYLGLSNILTSGKTPRIIGMQWNQWEQEAGNANAISMTDAPTNYTNLFTYFYSAIGSHYPVQFVQPLSTGYGLTKLSQMQTIFASLVTGDPADYSVIDRSQVSSNIFSGGVLSGGDGVLHYNLDTQQWFATQAIGVCLTQASCGKRVVSLPTTPTN